MVDGRRFMLLLFQELIYFGCLLLEVEYWKMRPLLNQWADLEIIGYKTEYIMWSCDCKQLANFTVNSIKKNPSLLSVGKVDTGQSRPDTK